MFCTPKLCVKVKEIVYIFSSAIVASVVENAKKKKKKILCFAQKKETSKLKKTLTCRFRWYKTPVAKFKKVAKLKKS